MFYGIKTIQNNIVYMSTNSKKKKGKVLVMMSGGVDSSVAAALLVKSGFEVEGAYMKNFSPESWQGVLENNCPWEQDVKDVEAVCDKLGIKWRSFNFEPEYKNKVIDYFFREYEAGNTPNPDVMCNKEIKFGIFLQKAIELGFDYVATGHYIQIKNEKLKSKNDKEKVKTIYKLRKSKDEIKDQSYFLWQLDQNQLARAIFPLGPYNKKEVRALAKKFGLPNSAKKDSQGLCFVGHIKLQDFLGQKLPKKPGKIIEKTGKVLGEHDGAHFYTVGQRKGIGLPQGPYYVAERNVETNTLVVDKNPADVLTKECWLYNINWISGQEPKLPLSCGIKIRSQGKEVKAKIFKDGEELKLVFDIPQFAVASGQSIVFYKRGEMLGGGVVRN